VYIDKGSDDGLKPDMAVITPDGVVGKLRDVFSHTSQVLLISDQTSGAGVLLSTTRIRAILHGSPTGRLEISNLTPDARIKPGEAVLTSGGDQIYPHGLPVGTIESIAPDPDHTPYTLIQLRPAANLNQLEEVLVITGTESTLPAPAQKDLAAGASTAEAKAAADEAAAEAAANSAAQVIEDRLPSMHDPAHPDTDVAPPAAGGASPASTVPGGAIPHPLPTVHTDRYTPGATPPAADLQRGVENTTIENVSPPPAETKSPKTPAKDQPDSTTNQQ
jgi:rod shape-determining protein MreC